MTVCVDVLCRLTMLLGCD